MKHPTAPLPVTVITHEFFPMMGGIATFVEEMASALHAQGHPTEVWAPATFTPLERRFPFTIRRIPIKGTQGFFCQLRMAQEVFKHRTDLSDRIVYLPEPGPLLALAYMRAMRMFRPSRLVLTFHGTEVNSLSTRPFARPVLDRLVRAADRVSCLSRFTGSLVEKYLPSARGKIVITPGAVRAHFARMPATHSPRSHKVVIVTVARLHPRKGQLHVLEALNLLPDHVLKDVEYWIIGRSVRGNYEARLRRKAAHARCAVTFHGNIDHDDLELIYRRADIFALTSVNHKHSVEGFGLAYLEASAFGLPVVGFDVGGVSEAVQNGRTGLLVPERDIPALAAALERLIRDAALRRQLGEAGARWVAGHSWPQSARILLDGISHAPNGAQPSA